METIFIGECHHLFNDDIMNIGCLKKYFKIFNVLTLRTERIAICYEYLKLTIHQKLIERYEDEESKYYKEKMLIELLSDIFYDITNKNVVNYRANNDYKFLYVQMCDNPRLYYKLTIQESFDIYLDENIEYCDFKMHLLYSIREYINRYLKRICSLVKYKKYKNEAIIISNMISKTTYLDKDIIYRLINFISDTILKI